MGILGGAFYFHNISLPVIRNSTNPDKNVRDVFIGYVLVLITYLTCGILGVYGFTGSAFEKREPVTNYIEQNCLNMFGVDNVYALIARLCCFF